MTFATPNTCDENSSLEVWREADRAGAEHRDDARETANSSRLREE